MVRSPDDETALVRLVHLPYAVEVLDALDGPPMTLRRLRRVLLARRAELTSSLRALAAYGAIRRRAGQGSWDDREKATTSYELTDTGHDVLAVLNRIDVWEEIYLRYLHRH
jgi:DNA-binding HxlR family transcriptional regulator